MRVNGEPGELNTFVEGGDVVEVDGEPVAKQQLAYVLLHKPAGVVTTASDPQGRPTVVELVSHESRVVPVGRLDVETTGALLLTNDGPLAHRLAHPRYGVEKVYEVETWKEPDDEALRRLAEGVELEDGFTAPARVRRLGAGRFELVLHEGRNRQVRRMTEAVGHRVRSLHRSVYAGLEVAELAPGETRELREDEVRRLRTLVYVRLAAAAPARALPGRLRRRRRGGAGRSEARRAGDPPLRGERERRELGHLAAGHRLRQADESDEHAGGRTGARRTTRAPRSLRTAP